MVDLFARFVALGSHHCIEGRSSGQVILLQHILSSQGASIDSDIFMVKASLRDSFVQLVTLIGKLSIVGVMYNGGPTGLSPQPMKWSDHCWWYSLVKRTTVNVLEWLES